MIPHVVTTETWHHSSGSAQVTIKVNGNQRDIERIAKAIQKAITIAMPKQKKAKR